MAKIIVSACLAGCDCTYRGDSNRCEALIALAASHDLIPVCPEQLGGLSTPRRPSEIQGDRVMNDMGEDVTLPYTLGAENALRIAELTGAKIAVLKANSPSCGSGTIYDGTFSHTKVRGDGITAALFKQNGIKIFNETEIEELKVFLDSKASPTGEAVTEGD